MASSRLPGNGELRLGGVTLPAGHRVTPEEAPGPAAWVTRRAIPGPGEAWAACVSCGPDAGLEDDDKYGLTEIRDIAAALMDAPVWTLAWDD